MMLSIVLAVAVMGAEPKAVSGSEYYMEAVETLDRCQNDKETSAAVVRLNKKWSKRRIVVEFQVTGHPQTQMFYDISTLEKEGDWMQRCMRAWLPPKSPLPRIGTLLIFSGTPMIGGKTETAFGTIHAGGKSMPFQLANHSIVVKAR